MAPGFPGLQDAGWLHRKYELEGLSSYAIAAELGCRATTVSRALRRYGIAVRMGRPAVVGPGQVHGRLTVLGELPERTRGGRVFRCRCVCGARGRPAGGRTAAGKDPLLRLPARRDKAERPQPAAERAQRPTLRTARRPARGRAREPTRRQDLRLWLRRRRHHHRSWRQPHQRAHPFLRMPTRGVPPARHPTVQRLSVPAEDRRPC
jgi:hypothetical protein